MKSLTVKTIKPAKKLNKEEAFKAEISANWQEHISREGGDGSADDTRGEPKPRKIQQRKGCYGRNFGELATGKVERVGIYQLTIHEEAAAEYPIYQWPSFRNKTKRNSTRRHSVAGSKNRGRGGGGGG
jgi:hypothetical protein